MTTGMEHGALAVELTAAQYLSQETGYDVVTASLEGGRVLLGFQPDLHEHPRRQEHSLGAVRSRRLLYALWTVPYGAPWPVEALDELDAKTLESEGHGWVVGEDGIVVRLYQPPGRIRAIGLQSNRLAVAVRRVSLFPPVFLRFALGLRRCRTDRDAVITASSLGIGAAVKEPSGLVVHSRARLPQTGVPGVYRWWLAEVAYDAWLQTNAH